MAYNIPSKINSFNVYKDGTKLVGISDEVTLPDFESWICSGGYRIRPISG